METEISDFSGSFVAKMGERVALQLIFQDSKHSFEEAFENGTLSFSRACVRVKREVITITDDASGESRQVVNAIVVAGSPQKAGEVMDIPFPLKGQPILPCSISSLRVSAFGDLVVCDDKGSQYTVKAAICLLRGAKSPKTELRDGAFSVVNEECADAWDSGSDATVTCFTIAPVLALVNFSFNKNKVALVRITAGRMADSTNVKEVLVSDMWSMQGTETEAEVCEKFKKEVHDTITVLTANTTKKRKWTSKEDLVNTFYTQSTKRICPGKPAP